MHQYQQALTYLQWLNDRGIAWPVPQQKRAAAPSSLPKYVVVLGETPPNAHHIPGTEAEHLLVKMLAAVPLEPDSYGRFTTAEFEAVLPQLRESQGEHIVLYFGEDAGSKVSSNSQVAMLTLHHPASLLIDPALKRPTWELLKTLQN